MKGVLHEFYGVMGQWIAVVLVSFGIIIEISYHADIGYIGITVGAFFFGVFTKIRYYSKKKAKRKR